MEAMRNSIYEKHNNLELSLNINLKVVGIIMFTLFFSILKSFILFEIGLLLLLFSIILLLFSSLVMNKKGIFITRIDIMWFLFLLLFIMNIAINNLFSSTTITDIFIYTCGIFFMLLVKVDINYYKYPLKVIKVLGIIYAFSAIFQYLYTDIYMNYVLPLFIDYEQESIFSLLRNNSYAGFTNQTAHLAGYIVSGIGVLIFSKWKNNFSSKFISIILILFMLTGLLLTGKRAHLLFMIIAIIVTFIFSINNKKLISNLMKLATSVIIVVLLTIVLYSSINFEEESPIVSFANELEETFYGIIEGEDVTSGRTILYTYSLALFKEDPILGIGWKEFFNNSIGILNSDRGSHPHNIYIQLLTEMGITGLTLFAIPVLYVYYRTYRMLRILSRENNSFLTWKLGIQFSFFSQTFLLLYGLTGNLLTDYNFLLWYFFACSISLSAMILIKRDQLTQLKSLNK